MKPAQGDPENSLRSFADGIPFNSPCEDLFVTVGSRIVEVEFGIDQVHSQEEFGRFSFWGGLDKHEISSMHE